MTTLEIVLTIVSTVFGSVGFWTLIQHEIDKKSASRKMIMGMTYINIVKNCDIFLDRGWVDTEELADLRKYLYEPYRQMGGNGTAEAMMRKVDALPNKPVD